MSTSPCSSCTRRCCSEYTVSVTGYDAWLLATVLHLPLDSFLVSIPGEAGNPRGFTLEPGGARYEIALDKVGEYRKGDPCVFWIDLANGRGRCGIYSVRPLVCQTYPAYLDDDCVALREDVLCPPGAWQLAGLDLARLRGRLARLRMEQDVYAYVVDGWNRALERRGESRSLAEYYAYLIDFYAALDELHQSLDPAGFEGVVAAWNGRTVGAANPLMANLGPPSADLDALLEGITRTVDALAGADGRSRGLRAAVV